MITHLSTAAMDEIMVTVICLAYNHAKYIRDALEGFVSQRTSFPFEVIVHDDASTDGTTGIIREYQSAYPDIIKPVFQSENQYSRKVRIPQNFIFPLVRGRYVALCEGDDYWTDPLKLQKQVDALEACPGADICIHRAARRKKGRFMGWVAPAWRDRLIPVEEVILGGGANFSSTASILCRREVYLQQTPMREVITNDYVLAIQGSLRGGMLYLHDPMSVYRLGVEGSWSSRNKGKAKIPNKERLIRMLSVLDEYTGGIYHKAISTRIEMFRSDILMLNLDYLKLFSPRRLGINVQRFLSVSGRMARRWLSFL